MNDEFQEEVDEVIDSLEAQWEALGSAIDQLDRIKHRDEEIDMEHPEEEVRDELQDVMGQLHGVTQQVFDGMSDLHKLRQGKTPFFPPGTPEQDAAMAAISGNKAAARFSQREIVWPLNDLEDWEEIENEPPENWNPKNGSFKESVEGTDLYKRRGPAGTMYYVVMDKSTFDPV